MKFALPFTALLLILASFCQAEAVLQEFNKGKNLAFDRDKGNCLACHAIEEGESPGNIGPPLKNLQARFKDKQQLRQQIWDATVFNPDTSMPPYGRNKILTEDEIDRVVDYLWSLK
jgi:sulfur-oxidizing protein SoxX